MVEANIRLVVEDGQLTTVDFYDGWDVLKEQGMTAVVLLQLFHVVQESLEFVLEAEHEADSE